MAYDPETGELMHGKVEISDFQGMQFQCSTCGMVIRDADGQIIRDEESLIEFLKARPLWQAPGMGYFQVLSLLQDSLVNCPPSEITEIYNCLADRLGMARVRLWNNDHCQERWLTTNQYPVPMETGDSQFWSIDTDTQGISYLEEVVLAGEKPKTERGFYVDKSELGCFPTIFAAKAARLENRELK
ncbi:MAG: hypothetical protein M0036_19155 [Desulfobacteraceae bacterium]|nr:hypothetical protein [Desulfobacteraceae bacterium]